MCAHQLEHQRRQQRPVHDEPRVALFLRRIVAVVVNPMAVERERRVSEQPRRIERPFPLAIARRPARLARAARRPSTHPDTRCPAARESRRPIARVSRVRPSRNTSARTGRSSLPRPAMRDMRLRRFAQRERREKLEPATGPHAARQLDRRHEIRRGADARPAPSSLDARGFEKIQPNASPAATRRPPAAPHRSNRASHASPARATDRANRSTQSRDRSSPSGSSLHVSEFGANRRGVFAQIGDRAVCRPADRRASDAPASAPVRTRFRSARGAAADAPTNRRRRSRCRTRSAHRAAPRRSRVRCIAPNHVLNPRVELRSIQHAVARSSQSAHRSRATRRPARDSQNCATRGRSESRSSNVCPSALDERAVRRDGRMRHPDVLPAQRRDSRDAATAPSSIRPSRRTTTRARLRRGPSVRGATAPRESRAPR